MECKICFNECDNIITFINNDNNNEVFDYCIDCLTFLLNTLWNKYIELIKHCDCKVALKRLLSIGPPFYFRDEKINGGNDIMWFYYNDSVINGKTKGSLDIQYKNSIMEQLRQCNLYTINIDMILMNK